MARTQPLLLAGLVVLAFGCGRKAPPAAMGLGGEAGPQPLVVEVGSQDAALAPGTPVHEGRTAPQWMQQLEAAPTPVLRQQAGRALSGMGDTGQSQLLKGLAHGSDPVRLSCLQAISQPMLAKNANETLPLLLGMLQERNPDLRKAAAARLPWFPWKKLNPEIALAPLRAMSQRDPDPGVRRAAQESIIFINEVVTGTMDYGPK